VSDDVGPLEPVNDDVGPPEPVIDARGLRCPAPVIALAAAARQTTGVITVWWTDPAAEYDIPAWARMRGHEVLGTEPLRSEESNETADDAPTRGAPYATRVRITSP